MTTLQNSVNGRRFSAQLSDQLAVHLPASPLFGSDSLKRVFDFTLSGLGLLVLAPLFVVIGLLIKLDGGPVIFRQKRVGKDGREFWFYKFRSMSVDAEQRRENLIAANQHGHDGITFKMKRDPRVTRVGRVLRKSSLDELPQLWNVLKGDMSLVGPRPAIPAEVARYTSYQSGRLAVAPGLTCLWQIAGRADIPFETQVELDLEYINRRSFWFDLVLMARTLPALISGRGAY